MQQTPKTALIIGASGLIGSELVQLLINDSRYDKINLLVRKPLAVNHTKINQIQVNFEKLEQQDVVAHDVFCCLGTTIKIAKTKEAFFKVDFDYVVNTAKIAKSNNIAQFAVVSSLGADKNSTVFYSKTKGQMEESVSSLNFDLCAILRPSMLLGNRLEFRLGEKIGSFFMILFSFLIPKKYKAIQAHQVALAMIFVLNSNKRGVVILENNQLLEIKK